MGIQPIYQNVFIPDILNIFVQYCMLGERMLWPVSTLLPQERTRVTFTQITLRVDLPPQYNGYYTSYLFAFLHTQIIASVHSNN